MITLPELPYEKTALEPYISERTLDFHYGKHHASYVKKLNGLIEDTPLAGEELEEIIIASRNLDDASIFNNAAQVWNHSFFWKCLSPSGGGEPKGRVAAQIEESFGGYEKFREQFKAAAAGQFGSGWAWLVSNGGKLKITTTGNAGLPLVHGQKALLTLDLWEHAYYLDYQNRRGDYIDMFFDHLVNWDFANEN